VQPKQTHEFYHAHVRVTEAHSIQSNKMIANVWMAEVVCNNYTPASTKQPDCRLRGEMGGGESGEPHASVLNSHRHLALQDTEEALLRYLNDVQAHGCVACTVFMTMIIRVSRVLTTTPLRVTTAFWYP
jgi:hypothetical protein